MFTLCFLVAQVLAAPSTIPVYPGAEKVEYPATGLPASVHETLMGVAGDWPLLAGQVDDYIARAPIERVVAYYQRALGGVASSFEAWKALDPRALSPGSATPVHRQQYTAAGTTQYLYHWYRKEPNGDISLFELNFSETIDLRNPDSRERVSGLGITRKTYSKSAANPAPGLSELNAPVYPGSIYDSNLSQTSPWGHSSQVFRTNAPINEVVAFYERALNRKALKGQPPAGGETWFITAYSPQSEPDDYLTVEDDGRPGQPGSYRTRIIFTLDRFKDDPVK